MQGKNTGIENDVSLAFSVTNGGSDPFAGGGDVVQAAADAQFTVNGLSLTRSSNTVSGAIPGVSLSLLKEGGVSSTVSVANDTSAITANAKSLVDAYNAVAKIGRDQFALNGATGRQGALAGDSTLRATVSRLRNALTSVQGGDGSLRTLSDLGIRFEKDGSLSLDESKLTNTLSQDREAMQKFFLKANDGIGKRIPDAVDSLIGSVGGAITARQNGLNESIQALNKKIAREEQRISKYQEQLTAEEHALLCSVSNE